MSTRKINYLINQISSTWDRECISKFCAAQYEHLIIAKGSRHNHQNWQGGYIDHIVDCFHIANMIYPTFPFKFRLDDALVVLFLHDIEKPFISYPMDKVGRSATRKDIIAKYEFILTDEQKTALKYVEGEGDDYSSEKRVMNELGAFCHICDVMSSRIFHSEKLLHLKD